MRQKVSTILPLRVFVSFRFFCCCCFNVCVCLRVSVYVCVCWPSTLEHEANLEFWWAYSVRLHWGRLFFLFMQVPTADSFLVGMGTHVHLSCSVLEAFLAWIGEGSAYIATVSVSYMDISPVVSRGHTWSHTSPLTFTIWLLLQTARCSIFQIYSSKIFY